MTEINVKGDVWDVESIEDGVVTLADGSTISVREETAKSIEDQLKSLKNTFKKAVSKK